MPSLTDDQLPPTRSEPQRLVAAYCRGEVAEFSVLSFQPSVFSSQFSAPTPGRVTQAYQDENCSWRRGGLCALKETDLARRRSGLPAKKSRAAEVDLVRNGSGASEANAEKKPTNEAANLLKILSRISWGYLKAVNLLKRNNLEDSKPARY